MAVLVCLAGRPGSVCSRTLILDEVWEGAFVSEDVLRRAISELRKAFGDDAKDPRYIETIPKGGYRLIADVSPLEENISKGGFRSQKLSWLLVGAVLVLGLGLWLSLRSGRSSFPSTDSEVRPLTSFPGIEGDPDLSPDGRQVVFVWKGDEDNFDLFKRTTDSDTLVRLTRTPQDEMQPRWSPDGKSIAFVRSGASGSRILIIPSGGGLERQLQDLPGGAVRGLSWAPDGTKIAASIQERSNAPSSIYFVSVESVARRAVTRPPENYWGDTYPSFAPDGRELAFTRTLVHGISDIFLLNGETDSLKRLTSVRRKVGGLAWTPDGSNLLFSSYHLGGYKLWLVPAAGGVVTPVGFGGLEGRHPSISTSGDLVYQRVIYDTNIWGLRRDSSAGPRRIIASTQWDSSPSFAPAGNRFVFVSTRTGSAELWVSDVAGSNVRRITSFGGPLTTNPAWSPDGRHIAFESRKGGSSNIFLIDPDGQNLQRLTGDAGENVSPTWSREGRSLYFSSNRSGDWQIWKMRLGNEEEGDVEQVTQKGGTRAMESSDGRFLYLSKRNSGALWRLSLDGGKEVAVHGVSGMVEGDWQRVGMHLFYVEKSGLTARIQDLDISTGTISTVASLPAVPDGYSLAVSGDGQQILYSHLDRNDSDIVLIRHFR